MCDCDLRASHDSLDTVRQGFFVLFGAEPPREDEEHYIYMYRVHGKLCRQFQEVCRPLGISPVGQYLSHLGPLTLQKVASATGQTEDLTFSFSFSLSFFLSFSDFRNSTTRSRDFRIYSKNVQYLQCKVGQVPTPSPSPPRSIFI